MIALSTAFKRALIAADIDGREGYDEIDANCKHSENILVSLDNLLTSLDRNLTQNDCYSVIVGPGSFTGIRIGIALIKGFLKGGGDKKLISISSLELMAYSYINNYDVKEDFCCVIDALSKQYFVCEFDKSGRKIGVERLVGEEEAKEIKLKKITLSEENVEFSDVTVSPTANELLGLSKNKYEEGQFIGEESLKPLYIRKSQAEDNLKS